MEYIKAYTSFTLVWREMFWSFHMDFIFPIAAEVCAALARISAFDPKFVSTSLIAGYLYLSFLSLHFTCPFHS